MEIYLPVIQQMWRVFGLKDQVLVEGVIKEKRKKLTGICKKEKRNLD
jgi:hypothetical protein